jgi:hypothetical protein
MVGVDDFIDSNYSKAGYLCLARYTSVASREYKGAEAPLPTPV